MPQAGIDQTSFLCSFCHLDLETLPISNRELHYEQHLNNDLTLKQEGSRWAPIDLESMTGSSNTFWTRNIKINDKITPPKPKMSLLVKEMDIFWYPGFKSSPPRNHVPGLIHVLRRGLIKGHNRGSVRRAALCCEDAVLIHREIWDASWGCGYRNFLMACACLMKQQEQPNYAPLLESPLLPSVRNLQSWIEEAWAEGFDAEGKKDLQKLIGTRKWIGTADIWVAFVSRRIPAQLVDFDLRDKTKDALIDWVVEYFTPKANQERSPNAFDSLKGSSILDTQKMPLILQHDGHSRTVVGYEVDQKGATSLLVFDPAFSPNAQLRNLAMVEYCRPLSSRQASTPETGICGLKRKRSGRRVNDKQYSLDENSKAGTSTESGRISSPLKSSLQKVGIGKYQADVDLYSIVKKFRLEPKRLEKKKQYQILYFPMSGPLSEIERNQRKQVTSIKIS